MSQTILVIGTFDSKKTEYEFLIKEIISRDFEVISMDIGTYSNGLEIGTESISSDEVVAATGRSLESIRSSNDRGLAMKLMADGAEIRTRELFEQGRIHGVIGMGGSGGSSVISKAMRALPIGVPKVLLSTMVGENTSEYVGCTDVVMIPSITDISGLNRISRKMISSAAAAVTGMAEAYATRSAEEQDVKVIAVSMFGNTTECVDLCRARLENEQTEVIVFHATGTGGKTMENLIKDGMIDACLDITTTEIADEICGGILSAGPDRLSAAGRRGIPHLVVPGCVDMVNFGGPSTVPEKYRNADRNFYEWNPSVTLMRTNIEENKQIGEYIAGCLNQAKGPVQVLIPKLGFSILGGDGERFCDREADQALVDTLKDKLLSRIEIIELNCNINDKEFAKSAVSIFEALLQAT